MPEIVSITADQLDRMHELDVTEEIDRVYLQQGSRLELIAQIHSRSPRAREDWASEVSVWQGFVAQGGAAWGVFENGRMIASAVLRNDLQPETSQLAGLYVDRASRRTGIGMHLVDTAAEAASDRGARRLYVSAIPSEATVDFYLSVGFEPLEKPNPDLFALEPEDIHMCMSLENPRPRPHRR